MLTYSYWHCISIPGSCPCITLLTRVKMKRSRNYLTNHARFKSRYWLFTALGVDTHTHTHTYKHTHTRTYKHTTHVHTNTPHTQTYQCPHVRDFRKPVYCKKLVHHKMLVYYSTPGIDTYTYTELVFDSWNCL